ncbi:MAG: quinolinate synthase NadA, partial [Candidatus Aenigmarchaeota archaeon]|nr:quinolinate synthase NadA [Candidatus Aenigmarchaeota archaeon]
ENPGKIFYPVGSLCEGMKRINLEKVKYSLENMEYKVRVPEDIRIRAKKALDRMLEVT